MIGIGTILNVVGIVAGGICGLLFGGFLKQKAQDTLNMTCGVTIFIIGLAGTMEGMLSIQDGSLTSGKSMFIVICLALGAFIGELIDIESGFERFGEWLKIKSGNAKDKEFVNAFVTCSLTVCIGAMGIVGSIQDGLTGDYSISATKAILDFIIVMVMTCSMGKGSMFSAVPIFFYQGSITLLASLVKPLMTELALFNISLIGSILICCVGINLVWGKKVRVANLLPSIIIAIIMAFLPFNI